MSTTLYMNWQNRLKITSDLDGAEILYNRDFNLPRATLTLRQCTVQQVDVAASATVTINFQDLSVIQFLLIAVDEDNFTFNPDAVGELPLRRQITGQPAIVQWMTNIDTSLTVTAGATGGRVTVVLAGTD